MIQKPAPRIAAVLFVAGLVTGPALAERRFIDEPEPVRPSTIQEPEYWSEGVAALPPWPKDADLVELRLDGPSGLLRYYIDGRNLAVGNDEVVRYTLVAESASGARNISFEGIRCTPKGEHRIYAYGIGGRFEPAPAGDWQRLPAAGTNDYRRQLHGQVLCVPLKFEPRPKRDMLRAMKGPVHPRENAGFMTD
jgi:hypothetical protein